jgi:hypothetical protein
MKDEMPKDTFIKDSNVEILIANDGQQGVSANKKNTDYASIIILALVILAIGGWGILTKLGFIKPLSF